MGGSDLLAAHEVCVGVAVDTHATVGGVVNRRIVDYHTTGGQLALDAPKCQHGEPAEFGTVPRREHQVVARYGAAGIDGEDTVVPE